MLGKVAGISGLHPRANHPEATTWPDLLLRLNAPLVFLNANYFRQQVERTVERAGADLRWLVVDAMPLTQADGDAGETCAPRGADSGIPARVMSPSGAHATLQRVSILHA